LTNKNVFNISKPAFDLLLFFMFWQCLHQTKSLYRHVWKYHNRRSFKSGYSLYNTRMTCCNCNSLNESN